MSKIELYIPTENELAYRRHLISDKETMDYNVGYGDNGTGCYYQTIEQVRDWYKNWNNGTDNYYAYIICKDDNTPIGEVDIHWSGYCQKHIIGIVIEAKYRGKGYAEKALNLLCDVAFNELNLEKIYDDFPETRKAAEKAFSKVGFIRENDEFVFLTKERYNQIYKK